MSLQWNELKFAADSTKFDLIRQMFLLWIYNNNNNKWFNKIIIRICTKDGTRQPFLESGWFMTSKKMWLKLRYAFVLAQDKGHICVKGSKKPVIFWHDIQDTLFWLLSIVISKPVGKESKLVFWSGLRYTSSKFQDIPDPSLIDWYSTHCV